MSWEDWYRRTLRADDTGEPLVHCSCQREPLSFDRVRALSGGEEARVRREAGRRNQKAIRRGQPDASIRSKDDAFVAHVLGCRGELVWCIANGDPWRPDVDRYGQLPDFDPDIEIRLRLKWYSMTLRDKDISDDPIDGHPLAPVRSNRRWVHITQREDGTFDIGGWLMGWEAIPWCPTDPNGKGYARFVPVNRMHRIDPRLHHEP